MSEEYIKEKIAVILSESDANTARDKQSLRKLGIDVSETFPMAAPAVAFMLENTPNLIVTDTELDDMNGLEFLQGLKKNHALKHIPAVVVTSEGDKHTVLDYIAAGCSGYVLRPYNQETFQRHVTTAMQLQRFDEIEMQQLDDAKNMLELGHYDDAIEEFEEVIAAQENAQKYYDMGCHYLIKRKYGKAIVSFQKAIRINDLFAEAYQGLAEAYKGKGDMDKSKSFLKKAAEIFAEFDRLEQVKEVFVEILKLDHTALNPFNTLGVKLRKKGDYPGAVHAYQQAIGLTPNDEHIYFNMAKAYYFMGEEAQALEKTTVSLSLNSDFPEAKAMYRKIRGQEWKDDPHAKPKPKSEASDMLMDV